MPVTIAPGVYGTGLSGFSTQGHLIYAEVSDLWYAFWCDDTDPTLLQWKYSSDLITWTLGDGFTLAHSLTPAGASYLYPENRSFAVAYRNIDGHDIVHFAIGYQVDPYSHPSSHFRAEIVGTTVTFGTEATLDGGDSHGFPLSVANERPLSGAGSFIDESGRPLHVSGTLGGLFRVQMGTATAQNVDTGVAWPDTWNAFGAMTPGTVNLAPNRVGFAPLSSGRTMIVYGEPAAFGFLIGALEVLWNGTSLAGPSVIFHTTATNVASDQLAVVGRTTSDVHVVMPDVTIGTNQLVHWRYDGSTWTEQTPPPQIETATNGGLYLATDGTHVLLVTVSSVTGTPIKYIRWNSTSGRWSRRWQTALGPESGNPARSFVSGNCTALPDGRYAVLYTQANGTAWDLKILVFRPKEGILPSQVI